MFFVIMAGGSGTRFWPLSRKKRPKQFLSIFGKDPLILETYRRISQIADDRDICIILGKEHVDEAKRIFEGKRIHIIAEPFGRNTAPCIALGALYAKWLKKDGAIAFLPADHFIGDTRSFLDSLLIAGKIGSDFGKIVTLGIVPNRPETGYGYIKRSEDYVEVDGKRVFRVERFEEKPDIEKAKRYIETGRYFWNAGIFIANPDTIIDETKKCLPELYSAFSEIRIGKEGFEEELRKAYEKAPNISFDYGVMEKTKAAVYVIPTECGWSDVGSWFSVYELRKEEHDKKGNLIEGDVIEFECERSFISSKGGRIVACVGLKEVLVVDTGDALLVADIKRSQDVRRIVEELEKRGKKKYL